MVERTLGKGEAESSILSSSTIFSSSVLFPPPNLRLRGTCGRAVALAGRRPEVFREWLLLAVLRSAALQVLFGVVDQALIGAAVPQRVQSPLQSPGLVIVAVSARFRLLTFHFGDLLPAQRLVGENGGRQSGVQDNQGSGQGEKRWFRHGANPFG